MKVPDTGDFTRAIAELFEQTPGFLNEISRVVPAHAAINFRSPQEFTEKASAVVLDWCDMLAGKSFYIRLHRRGFKGQIASPEAECFLDDVVLGWLSELGRPGRIDFEDSDFVVDIELSEITRGSPFCLGKSWTARFSTCRLTRHHKMAFGEACGGVH